MFNPEGTQTLAAQTLVERFYAELVELGAQTNAGSESLLLVKALAERALADDAVSAWAQRDAWQLRLIVTDDESDFMDVVYESDWWSWAFRGATS